MYIEKLHTPHPDFASAEAPRPLLDAVPFDDIRRGLDAARVQGAQAYARAVTDALPDVIQPVRRSMRYIGGDGPNGQTSPLDTLSMTGHTHCFGYTYVMSEALERLGVPHWIGVIGNHATNLVPLRPWHADQLYVADAMKPNSYSGYIGAGLHLGTVRSIAAETTDPAHPRGVAMLNLQVVGGEYARLAHDGASGVTTMRASIIDGGEIAAKTLVVSAFLPQVGRAALAGTAAYRAAVAHKDALGAAEALHAIPGLYYDIDARIARDDIRFVVEALCGADDFATARQVTHDYCQSFRRSKHTGLTELRADLLATIAEHANSEETLAQAVAIYGLAAKRAKRASTTAAIRAKVAALQGRFRPLRTQIGMSG